MLKLFVLSLCLVISSLSFDANAYTLVLKPKMNCTGDQILIQGSCVSQQGGGNGGNGGDETECSESNCPAPSLCLPNGEE